MNQKDIAIRSAIAGVQALGWVAVISYPALSPAGLKDHILWGTLMLVILFHGPGRLSLDAWLYKRFTP